MPKLAAIAAAAVAALGLGAGAWFVLRPAGSDPFAECRSTAIAAPGARLGGDFTLVSETGATVTSAEVVDGLALVYFGYTFCPDICPADAARNADAVDALAAQGVTVRPVFITIDPERDTPAVLAEFTDRLHPAMLGLTGTPEVLKAVQKDFLVYAAKAGTGDDYLMDHTAYSYLMAPGHGVIDVIRHEQTAEEIVKAGACFAKRL